LVHNYAFSKAVLPRRLLGGTFLPTFATFKNLHNQPIFGYFFTQKKLKNIWATFWVIFSHKHPVSLCSVMLKATYVSLYFRPMGEPFEDRTGRHRISITAMAKITGEQLQPSSSSKP
jgi:hypothetical protein